MRTIRYNAALREALRGEMLRDEAVFVLGEDVRASLRRLTLDLFEEFGPDRVLDTPVSESGFTGVATGAALAGLRPVVEYEINALVYVAFDQLVNQAQKLRHMMGGQGSIPVTYLIPGSGFGTGKAGQHADNPYAYLVHAGMKVALPSTPYDAKGLLTSAIREDDPVAVFAPQNLLGVRGEVPEEDYVVPLGKGDVKRIGSDVTVVATGALVRQALRLAEKLEGEGTSIEVFDPRTLLPLDKSGILESVTKTGRLVIFDDANRCCGFASEVAAVVAEEAFGHLTSPILRVARPTVPVPHSPPIELAIVPGEEDLRRAVDLLK